MVNYHNGKFQWKHNEYSYFIKENLIYYILYYHARTHDNNEAWSAIKDIYYAKLDDNEKLINRSIFWINTMKEKTVQKIPHIHFVFLKT